MYKRSAGGRWLEILLFTTSSLILYHTGVGFILFLVPLQVVASRRGVRGLALAAGVFLLVFLGIRFCARDLRKPGDATGYPVHMRRSGSCSSAPGDDRGELAPAAQPRTLVMLLAGGHRGGRACRGPLARCWLAATRRSSSPWRACSRTFRRRCPESSRRPRSGGLRSSRSCSSRRSCADGGGVPPAQLPAGLRDPARFLLVGGPGGGHATAALFGARPTFRFAEFRLEAAGCGRSSLRGPWCLRTCSSGSRLGVRGLEHRPGPAVPFRAAGPGNRAVPVREAQGPAAALAAA